MVSSDRVGTVRADHYLGTEPVLHCRAAVLACAVGGEIECATINRYTIGRGGYSGIAYHVRGDVYRAAAVTVSVAVIAAHEA